MQYVFPCYPPTVLTDHLPHFGFEAFHCRICMRSKHRDIANNSLLSWLPGLFAYVVSAQSFMEFLTPYLPTPFFPALNNSAAAIGDIFNASERAVAMSLFAASAFAGPVLG